MVANRGNYSKSSSIIHMLVVLSTSHAASPSRNCLMGLIEYATHCKYNEKQFKEIPKSSTKNNVLGFLFDKGKFCVFKRFLKL